jgi:hypothetical protein
LGPDRGGLLEDLEGSRRRLAVGHTRPDSKRRAEDLDRAVLRMVGTATDIPVQLWMEMRVSKTREKKAC